MTRQERKDPWNHAVAAKRDYLTPEDLGEAIKAGAGRFAIYQTTLEAIQMRRVEDWSLCAFVAVHSSECRVRVAPKRKAGR
jgi:hypothetical protein